MDNLDGYSIPPCYHILNENSRTHEIIDFGMSEPMIRLIHTNTTGTNITLIPAYIVPPSAF